MLTRRNFLTFLCAAGFIGACRRAEALDMFGAKKDKKGGFPFRLSDAEWREKLSDQEYDVMRKEGTERAFSSPLNDEKRKGVYHCKGCNAPLFSSEHKFDSGTGWPSFYQPISEEAIGYTTDYKLIYPRTEEHCANCGSHLGHVFNDGPEPTGKRHCINGVALVFKPAAA